MNPKIDPAPPPVGDRPKCKYCGRPLRPVIHDERDMNERLGQAGYPVKRRYWTGSYKRYGHFCTLRCGTKYANRVIDEKEIR